MTYELAKRLKEAGLKQPNKSFEEGYLFFWDGVEGAPKDKQYAKGKAITGTIWAPTSDELIEELGIFFFGLRRDISNLKPNFKSEDLFATDFEANGSIPSGMISTKGSTPLEALAELWIAVNKK